MAATDIVTAAKQIFFQGDISYKRATSESIMTKLASALNYTQERIYIQDKIVFGGFFNPNSFDNGSGGVIRVRRDSAINEYYMYIRSTGSSGTSSLNCAVYTSSGTLVGDLFSSGSLSISGNSGTNVIVGKQDVNGTEAFIDFNTGGHTVDNGSLNITTLLEGYVLVPYIEDNAVSAYNMTFNLKLQEL